MPLWAAAEKKAEASGQSLSGLVTMALRVHLPSITAEGTSVEPLTVEVGEERKRTDAFSGE